MRFTSDGCLTEIHKAHSRTSSLLHHLHRQIQVISQSRQLWTLRICKDGRHDSMPRIVYHSSAPNKQESNSSKHNYRNPDLASLSFQRITLTLKIKKVHKKSISIWPCFVKGEDALTHQITIKHLLYSISSFVLTNVVRLRITWPKELQQKILGCMECNFGKTRSIKTNTSIFRVIRYFTILIHPNQC